MRSLILLLLASALGAQRIPPGRGFGWTKEARAEMDSMAAKSVRTHSEQSACVTGYAMRDSIFIIGDIKPASNIIRTDSVQVIASGPPCAWWEPTLHSHILDNGWLEHPSEIDYRSTVASGTFAFLLSVKADGTWTIKAYP